MFMLVSPPSCIFVLFTTIVLSPGLSFLFFFNDTATTEIYTLSLHDALPICYRNRRRRHRSPWSRGCIACSPLPRNSFEPDRKSTRLNSSHGYISYAVFCLKKKKTFKCP